MLSLTVLVLASFDPFQCARSAPFHPAIHNLGNVGLGGRVHASLAHAATRTIDAVAYAGVDMRRTVAQMTERCVRPNSRVCDVGCGVGTLTQHLVGRYDVTGVDTSLAMLDVARRRVPGAAYHNINGVDLASVGTFDLSVVCMVMHELPALGHAELIDACCIASPRVWVVDIDPSYRPSPAMLLGEPYLPDYLVNFEATLQLAVLRHGLRARSEPVVPGHVRLWILEA